MTRPTATPVPGRPPGMAGNQDTVTLQYPNSDVQDVLHLYGQLTGKNLVMDNFVQGKVNIFISKPVPKDEAIRIIEMNLLMNGYSLVPAEGDIVKVIGTGKNPRTAGVPIISEESEIPAGDKVISYLFKLRYADPQELQQVLGQYLSPPQPYTSLLALPKSSAVLVTENSSVVRRLANIINQVDIPPAEVVSEFIRLDRADAAKVVELLESIFEQQGQPGTTSAPGTRGVRQVAAGPQQPVPPEAEVVGPGFTALSEDSVVVGKIKIAADVRTNRIHVITRPINMPFVRKLISELDANVEFAKPVTRSLRYISAGDVLPVLVQALTEPGQDQQQGAAPAPGGQPGQNQQQLRNTASTAGNLGGTSSLGGQGGGIDVSEELSTQPVDTAPQAVTVGNTKIIADQRSNSIIVLGNREVVVKVEKILDEMDVKAPQVALSTVIGELTLDAGEEFGVDWFLKYKNKVAGVSRNTDAPLPFPSVAPSASPGTSGGILDPGGLVNFGSILQAASAAGGTSVYVAAGNYLSAVVRAMESTGRFKVLSRPMVFTSNNKKAIIASGREIPVPVNTLSNAVNVSGIAQSTNIQYKRVALQLEVVPLINSEKEVSLDILQKVDNIAGSTIIDGNAIPNVATRYIRTHVSAPNNCTIVLGGLVIDSTDKNYSGIPVLSRIPLIGSLFRTNTKTKSRQELIVMMRPEVTMTKLDQHLLKQKATEKTHFGPELDETDCPDCTEEEREQMRQDKLIMEPDLPPLTDAR